ncbi:MAG: EAL domain-containing protein [Chromatiales bacterium]|nr:EAL domain-containing protein [Chromatiales bacterium]
MNDKTFIFQQNSKLYSLRQRYLFVSTIVVSLIFAFAIFAQHYVNQSSQQHNHNIEMRQQAAYQIRQLRDEILSIEKGLEAFMWGPDMVLRQEVHHNIDSALFYFGQLRKHQWFIDRKLNNELGDFELDIKSLHITLDRVMDLRQGNKEIALQNDEQHHHLNQAMQRFGSHANALQQLLQSSTQLESTIALWQQLRQEINSYINSPVEEERPSQEEAITELHRELHSALGSFSDIPQLEKSSEGQQLLREMREAMGQWHQSFDTLRYNNDSGDRHALTHYLKRTVSPHLDHIWEYIHELEVSIEKYATRDTATLERVATTIVKFVWGLSSFGLLVIGVAFVYFQRTVLQPIATIATALKVDASSDDGKSVALPQVYNLETRHLIDAYEEMRQQVQDRQSALEHIALHDSLTGLPNRYQMMKNLQSLCEGAAKDGAIFSVVMLGLDRFKEINDTLGQKTGDDILMKFGRRLRTILRESDMVSRFASDEFAVLLLNTDRDEALYVAHKIRKEMESPFDVDGISLSISCSMGIALYPSHSNERNELTRLATIAMASAKQHKVGIMVYDERYDTASVERISLAGLLREALRQDKLKLHYQAQFATHNGKLSGLEALCRWEDSERGPINPELFISVAEQTGQVHRLTQWVLDGALQQAMKWHNRGLDFGILAVNISAFNLHAHNFLTMLESLLAKWEFPAQRLMLEVTETAMMIDPDQAILTMREIHALGVKLSIDDYGTGFSSLAYVKQLPLHELKIDKSFVMDMDKSENDAIIVRSTIDLAHNLGLKVVAEGVDSKEKAELLEILNCDYLQGHYMGIPVSAHQIEQVLPPITATNSKVTHLRDFR